MNFISSSCAQNAAKIDTVSQEEVPFKLIAEFKSSKESDLIINLRFFNNSANSVMIDTKLLKSITPIFTVDEERQANGATISHVTWVEKGGANEIRQPVQIAKDLSRSIEIAAHTGYECTINITKNIESLKEKFPAKSIKIQFVQKNIILGYKSNLNASDLFELELFSNIIKIP